MASSSLKEGNNYHKKIHTCCLENTSDKWDIPWYTTRKRCIAILYHAIVNTEIKTLLNFSGNKIAAQHGNVGYIFDRS